MRTQVFGGAAAVVAVVLALLAYTSLYVVPQTQIALPLRFGQARDPKFAPGLYVKAPLIDNVVFIDNRILDLNARPQEVINSDQQRLVVDAFGRYRVVDPLKFYQAAKSVDQAEVRLAPVLESAVRRVLGQASFTDVVRDRRDELMRQIRDQVNAESGGFGIEVVDVRIRRADLPDANSDAVYQRMQTERQREAAQYRAQGSEQSQRIRAEADRSVARLLGEANGQASQVHGDADAQRSAIFATATATDPEFFAFTRSLQAYAASLRASNMRLVGRPDEAFFRYFNDPNGGTPAPEAGAGQGASAAPVLPPAAGQPGPTAQAAPAAPAPAAPAPATPPAPTPAPAQ